MPVNKLLINMSWPAMLSMLVQACYNIVDSIFVAQVGEKALTAVTLAFPMQMLVVSVGVGTGIGINSLISRRLGAKFFDEANMAASMGMKLAVFSWVVFAIIGLTCSEPFMSLFSDDAYITEAGTRYLTICLSLCLFGLFQMTSEKILQATGNMFYPMLCTFFGAGVNIILDPIFIFGLLGVPRLEVTGAAIATVIGQTCGGTLAMIILFKKSHILKIKIRGTGIDRGTIKNIYAVGAPSIIMQTLLSVMHVFFNGILAGLSLTAVAVMGVYGRLQSFVFMPVFGINQGSLPIFGYNYGAKNKKRFKDAYKGALIMASTIMAAGLVVFQLFPHQLLSLFSATPEMYEMGEMALRRISICFLPAAIGIVSSGVFQATGHGFISLFGSLIRQFIGILPIAFIMSRTVGLEGVWWSFAMAEVLGLTYILIMTKRLFKKQINTLED